MNASKAFLLNNGGAGGGGGASQSFAVFKDYGSNRRFDVGTGIKVAMPAPPAGKMRLWTGQYAPVIEGMQRFLGFGANPAGVAGTVSGQLKLAGFPVSAPALSEQTIGDIFIGVQLFLSAPGEAWEFDVTSFDPPATGISWGVSWRDFEGFIPVRVAPTFPAVATLIPVVLAGRVSVVGHPGIVAEFSSVPNVIVHNRDTVQHSYRVPQFSPGVAAAIGANTQGPVQPGDMVSLNIAYSILGEGASVGIEQLEATVTTPSMAFCCYQDLPLTP